ncbi:glycosyltransferase [Pseudoluteimonas lycopersici]|uniref:Glycosyltransferase n=1 Tax=Pseudoluteimonas lycopersici TaxID=1324796 RepID=A0A516V7C7_9GAMM|nr:glycosyltransferase [Lysobacter lycopersici]QDQ74413.1 glycosyltransferase [Lysobacter lycopersici]
MTATTPRPNPADSAGFLVLGMHRSGTSVLARLLAAAGANPGERLVPGSLGNEEGHWEDAFAVETNERLLSALGYRWDDLRPLPRDWMRSEAAAVARAQVREYLRSSLSKHPLWAIKDPRMCLFAELWLEAFAEEGCRPSVLLLGRHPQEIAASLAVRDGMANGKAMLLWLRHALDAERATRGLPRAFIGYDELFTDPDGVMQRISRLPGGERLQATVGGSGDGSIVRQERRHHRHDGAALPEAVELAWRAHLAAAGGNDDPRAFDQADEALASADGLFAPVLQELDRERGVLWDRTARAEAALAKTTHNLADVPETLVQLRETVDAHRGQVIGAVGEVRETLGAHRGQVIGAVGEVRETLDAHRGQVIGAVGEVRETLGAHRDQVVGAVGEVRETLGAHRDQVVGAVGEVRATLDAHRGQLVDAVGEVRATLDAHRGQLVDVVSEVRQTLDAHHDQVVGVVAEVRETLDVRHGALVDAMGNQVGQLTLELREQRQAFQGEMARMHGRLQSLQYDSDLLQQVRMSWSWRITRPLRVLRRLLSGGRQARSERRKLAALLSGREADQPIEITADGSAVDTGIRQGDVPAAANPERPDVFVWAVIDWHFRTQRPQHLASALAGAGHRVFYLSNNLVDSESPGFRVESLDASGRLFQVNLHAAGAPGIYYGMPGPQTIANLRRSIGELMQWADSDGGLCILQHPFWLDIATAVPGSALLYDCMDHHAGFENNAPAVIEAEKRLTTSADLLIVTSDWLDRELADANPHRALIRNATEYAHFRDRPRRVYRDAKGRRIIGYYGAIAEWFDLELVRGIAERFPDCLVLLIGHDTIGAAAALSGLDNVEFTGEVAYGELPYYLHAFDVALLPFRVIELTLATNPVKVYEYLSAGKPVVVVDLPETAQFGGLVHRARDRGEFLAAIRESLDESGDAAARLAQARKAFASEQTWEHRAQELDAAIASMPVPRVSVIVLAFNNLELTRACLDSIEAHSHWPNLEVIVVDNASSDGTREFLREWEQGGAGRKAILNDGNLGFAAGNNVGLAAATGEYLVLLNNDTYVTPNWVRTLVNHLRRNPGVGIVGPVTNNIGNEARIEIHYGDMQEMRSAAAAYTRRHAGELLPIRTVAFFCVAMPRSTYETVGPLDPAFGVGFFEDDDYCRRVEAAGLGVACAEDAFVHHHLSASFDKLKAETRQQLFLTNKAIYEAKWGEWQPHRYRGQADAG